MSLRSVTTSSKPCDPAIEQLLSEFASVFATPTGLSPCRGHEYQILLKDGIAIFVKDIIDTHIFRKLRLRR